MNTKGKLVLNLNYAHKNLSSAFRFTVGPIGLILLFAGIIGLIIGSDILISNVSFSLNIISGIVLILISSSLLPNFARRYFIVNNAQIKYKLLALGKRQSFNWNQIEQIEIDPKWLRIQLEFKAKIINIPLGIISYQDFELLQKSIIDYCVKKDIDIK